MTTTRSSWGSRFGFIFAAAGSAIGLGAIWKFPYVAAQNGGGAFLLIFLAFVFTLGVTLMMFAAAAQVAAGQLSLGDLVLVNALLLQLFIPLKPG